MTERPEARRRMDAEICTYNPDPIIKKLVELGFEVEVIDRPDGDGSTVFATTLTELDPDAFYNHVEAIVDPLDGTVMESGPVLRPNLVRRPGLVKRRFGRY